METYSIKQKDIKKDWYVVDAEKLILGRLASKVAQILRGKIKPDFTPHMDMGDFVIVINAEKIIVSGNKEYDELSDKKQEGIINILDIVILVNVILE